MRKLIVWVLILLLVVAPVAFTFLSFQPDPALPVSAQLSPRQAAASKKVINRARSVADGTAQQPDFVATQADMNALMATGSRFIKSLRGSTMIDERGVKIELSAQVPRVPQLGWVNFSTVIAPSANGLVVESVNLGQLSIPPGIAVPMATWALDAISSEDLGTLLIASVESVTTSPGRVVVQLDSGGVGENSLFDRVLSGVREAVGAGDNALITQHFTALSNAAKSGQLPTSGSVAPWFSFAVERVASADHASAADLNADLNAALLALAAHCGSLKAIQQVAGEIKAQGGGSCKSLTLDGRTDLRQHFVLSAALQAMGGSNASFGIGEIKELIDAGGQGGSGFSFDDIAADRAGIRFGETLSAADQNRLQTLAIQAADEAAIMPSIAGLDSRMTNDAFTRKYGEVDSPAYTAVITEIDGRIDALSFNSP